MRTLRNQENGLPLCGKRSTAGKGNWTTVRRERKLGARSEKRAQQQYVCKDESDYAEAGYWTTKYCRPPLFLFNKQNLCNVPVEPTPQDHCYDLNGPPVARTYPYDFRKGGSARRNRHSCELITDPPGEQRARTPVHDKAQRRAVYRPLPAFGDPLARF